MSDSDRLKPEKNDKYKRRSSILKSTKFEEETISQPLGTRRVSFADTHQVQEFILYDSSQTDSLHGENVQLPGVHFEQNENSGSIEMSLTMTLDNKIVCQPNNNTVLNTLDQTDDCNVEDMDLSLISTVNKLLAQGTGRGMDIETAYGQAIWKEAEETFDAVKQDIVEDMQIGYEPIFHGNVERTCKENMLSLKDNENNSEDGNTFFNHTQYATRDMSLTNGGFNRTVDPLCSKEITSSRPIFKPVNIDNLNKDLLTLSLPSGTLNKTRYTSEDMSLTLAMNKTNYRANEQERSIPVILEPDENKVALKTCVLTSTDKFDLHNFEANSSSNVGNNSYQVGDNLELKEITSNKVLSPQIFDKENVVLPNNLPCNIAILKFNMSNISSEPKPLLPEKPSVVNIEKSKPVLKDVLKANIFSSQRVKSMNIIKPGSRLGFKQQRLIEDKSVEKTPCADKVLIDSLLSPVETVSDEVNMSTENVLNIISKTTVQQKLIEPKFPLNKHSRFDIRKKLDILLKNKQHEVEPKIVANDEFSSPVRKICILSDGNQLTNPKTSKQNECSEILCSDLPLEESLIDVSMPHCPIIQRESLNTQTQQVDEKDSDHTSHLVSQNATTNSVPEKESKVVDDIICDFDNPNQAVVFISEIQLKENPKSYIIGPRKEIEPQLLNCMNSPKVHSVQENQIPVEELSTVSTAAKEDDIELHRISYSSEMNCMPERNNGNLSDFDCEMSLQYQILYLKKTLKVADVSDISLIGFVPPSSSTILFDSVDLKLCAEDMLKKMEAFRNITRKYLNNEMIEFGFMDDTLSVHLSFSTFNGRINYNSLISDVRMAPMRKDLKDQEKISYFISQSEIDKYQVKEKKYKICDLPECLTDILNMMFFAKEFMTDYANMDFHHNNISIEFKDNYALLTADMHSLFWRLLFDAQYKIEYKNYLRKPILPTFIEKTGVISDKLRSNLVDQMIKVQVGSNYFYHLSQAIKDYLRENPVYNKPPPNRKYFSWIY